MQSLADQLLALGLPSRQAAQAHAGRLVQEADEAKRAARKLAAKTGTATVDDLKATQTVGEFREVAKQLLTSSDDHLRDIIAKANQLRDAKADGAKRLVWEMYQVRSGLKAIGNTGKRQQFLNRAFRSADRRFDTDF